MTELWRRLTKNSPARMVLACLIPLALVFGAVWFLGVRAGNWGILLVLLCPLMHLFMMGAHGHGQGPGHDRAGHEHRHEDASTQPQIQERGQEPSDFFRT